MVDIGEKKNVLIFIIFIVVIIILLIMQQNTNKNLISINESLNNKNVEIHRLSEIVEVKSEEIRKLNVSIEAKDLENDKLTIELTEVEKRMASTGAIIDFEIEEKEEYKKRLINIYKLIVENKLNDSLPIYAVMGLNGLEVFVKDLILVDDGENKLEVLAETLSRDSFSGLPIEIISIVEVDGKKVVKVNLREADNDNLLSWKGQYFQGSLGSTETTKALLYTFFQPDINPDNWIDGIWFHYESEEYFEIGHVELLGSGIIWRKEFIEQNENMR